MAQCWCNSLQSFQAPVEIIQEKKKKVKASPRISNIYLRAVDCHATVFQINLRLNDTRCVVQTSTLMWFLMQALPQGLFCPRARAALGLPKPSPAAAFSGKRDVELRPSEKEVGAQLQVSCSRTSGLGDSKAEGSGWWASSVSCVYTDTGCAARW